MIHNDWKISRKFGQNSEKLRVCVYRARVRSPEDSNLSKNIDQTAMKTGNVYKNFHIMPEIFIFRSNLNKD